jgi:hypothetical protein
MVKAILNSGWSKWKAARTIWPYPDGWGTYRENHLTGERTILDTGLSKDDAEKKAKELNGENNDS